MTLHHIDDFREVASTVPRPFPWTVIGVMPTADEYHALGPAAFSAAHAFCYTVSDGPLDIWCPLGSVEGRWCDAEGITVVLNVIFAAVAAGQIGAGDDMLVPLDLGDPATPDVEKFLDGVFWLGDPVEDPDHDRYRCYRSPNRWVLPIRWSSPLGFPPENDGDIG